MSERMLAAAAQLVARGLSPGSSGNLSMRVGDRVIVTPTGSSLARLDATTLAEVSIDGTVISGEPSKELPLHLAVYRADPEARAVVHAHSPFATAIACLAPTAGGLADLPAFTPYRVMSLGEIPLVEYHPPGSPDLGLAVERAVGVGSRVILLANHGTVVAAASIERAVDLSEELETSAHLALLLRGRDARELSPSDIARLRPTDGR